MTTGAHGLSTEQIAERVRTLGEWFHNLDLDGVPTAPHHVLGDYPRQTWRRFAHAVPADLSGWTVLDVGCNAGFYAIEMKRRGADRVVGVDSDPRHLEQARFAAEISGVDVEWRQMSPYVRVPAPAVRRAPLRGRRDELVGAEPRVRRGHAAQRRVRDSRPAGARGLPVPALHGRPALPARDRGGCGNAGGAIFATTVTVLPSAGATDSLPALTRTM